MQEFNYTENMENRMFEIWGDDDDVNIDKVLDYLNRPEVFRDFGEGLQELIVNKYGEVDVVQFILNKAKDKEIVFNRNTVKNWIDGNRPKKGEQSREHMFKLAFTLELDFEEIDILFRKIYLDKPFNLRDRNEFIYYYCLKEGHSYKHAQMLIEELLSDETSKCEETMVTRMIEKDLILLKDDVAVIDYIKKHPHNFQINTVSAKRTLEALLNEVRACEEDKKKLEEKRVDKTCSYTIREYDVFRSLENEEVLLDKNKDISSISSMLMIIEGGDIVRTRREQGGNVLKNAKLPQEIKNRFPTKHTFTNDNPTFEELRKMIILLFSYKMWFEKQYEEEELELEDYIARMDDLLYDSGLQTMYYGNPFDWLFLYCTITDNPLDSFREIMWESIWDK